MAVEYPEFLNTPEKWNECVQNTSTLKEFEELFYKLMDNFENSPTNVFAVIKELEKDIVEYHGNECIYSFMEVVEAVVRYTMFTGYEQRQAEYEALEALEAEERRKQIGQDVCDCGAVHDLLEAARNELRFN